MASVLELAIASGLVGGEMRYTHSTYLKANAHKHRFEWQAVKTSPLSYLEALDAPFGKNRVQHANTLTPRTAAPAVVEKKISPTDPDSGYMVRGGKSIGFLYLQHRPLGGKQAINTDTHVNPASELYLARLDAQSQPFGFNQRGVGLDSGYFTAAVGQGHQSMLGDVSTDGDRSSRCFLKAHSGH